MSGHRDPSTSRHGPGPYVPGELQWASEVTDGSPLRLARYSQNPFESVVEPLDTHFLGISFGSQHVSWQTVERWETASSSEPVGFFLPQGIGSKWQNHADLDVLHIYLCPSILSRLLLTCSYDVDRIGPQLIHGHWVTSLATRLRALPNTGPILERLAADQIILAIGAALLDGTMRRPSRTPRGSLAGWQLRRITAKLSDEIERNVGLDELAALVGLSPTYLCSAFRRSTGMPPHQWQKQLRIDRAKVLLGENGLSITEIALEVGYANPGHFATLFKAATGLSPRDWRRERHR